MNALEHARTAEENPGVRAGRDWQSCAATLFFLAVLVGAGLWQPRVYAIATAQGAQAPQVLTQPAVQENRSRSPYGIVTGRLLFPDGSAASGVRVQAVSADIARDRPGHWGDNTKTDSAGVYRLTKIVPGRYEIVGGATPYRAIPTATTATILSVTAGSLTEGIDVPQPMGVKVSGRLVIAPALQHTQPVMVVLGQLLETPVRADATFEFRNVPPGRYPLSVEAVGLRGSTVDVGTRDIEGLVLGAEVPGVRVSGRIISSANNLSNLWVTITSSRRALGAPVNADGSFELLPVPLSGVQPATIVVSGNGQWASATLMVGDRDIAGFEIPAPFGASITGRVVIDDGSWLPVPKNIITSSRDYTGIILEVATEQVQGGFRGFQLRLPLDGAFNLMLAEGHYGITLRDVPEGYVVKSITFGPRDLTAVPLEIAPDKTSVGERGSPAPEILISLARAPWGAITGRILHTDGTPAIGVSIGAVPAPQILRATNAGGGITLSGIVQSDGNGRYRIDNVAPGEYYVVAGAPQMGLSDVYMTTPSYFPGASTRAGARLARVDSGATLEADLRLQEPAPPPTPSFTVSGRIAGPLGLPAEAKVVSVKLIIPAQTIRRAPSILERGPAAPCFADAAASFTSGVGPDGVFAIRNVAPGTYTACVTVVLAHSIGTIGAIQTVTVIDRNVTGVEFDGRAGVQYLPIKIN